MKLPTVILMTSLSVSVNTSANEINTSQKSYSVKIGSSRIIYNENSTGASIIVTNPEQYPVLIQSSVYAEDKTSRGTFIVAPPLFRLESTATSSLKILRNGSPLPSDRETMEWLCVKGVPPTEMNQAESKKGVAEVVLQVSINTCNKLLYRPAALEGNMITSAEKIAWKKEGGELIGVNNSPYFMHISDLSVGGANVFNPEYISPFSQKSFKVNNAGEIKWRVITDNGGESRIFTSGM
ncbi:fimbria/pilus periplasmic chaperone [Serratia fonticola]